MVMQAQIISLKKENKIKQNKIQISAASATLKIAPRGLAW
jgi:hypothetical protein